MRDNSRAGNKGNNKSGKQQRRGLRGRGPTPKAEDRPYHKAAKRKAGKPGKPERRREDSRTDSRRGERNDRRGERNDRRDNRRPQQRGFDKRKQEREKTYVDTIAGRNTVVEALRAGIPARELVVAVGVDVDDRLTEIMHHAQKSQLPVREVPRGKLEALTGIASHQGVALIVKLFIAVDGVTDPRNIGAIVRSAAAFGADGLIIPERRNASITATAWKASAGAAARLPIAQVTNLARAIDDAKEYGCFIVGLDGESDETIDSMDIATEPLMVIAGSEGKGLSRLVRDKCDLVVSIPMQRSVESLNASVAMSIALYEIDKKRSR